MRRTTRRPERRCERWRRGRTPRAEALEVRELLAADVILSEFMARNTATLQDDDLRYSDWIEVVNRGDMAAELDTYYLTDDAGELLKWRFPARSLSPGEHLIVFATGEDRTDPAATLHTNFQLDGDGEYLALHEFAGGQLRTATEFAPGFPPQREDVSYGIGYRTEELTLVAPGAEARYLVPDGPLDPNWMGGGPFDDSSWSRGPTGIGFDNEFPEPVSEAHDTFSRPNSGSLGTSEDPLARSYVETDTGGNFSDAARIVGGELEVFGIGTGAPGTGPGQAFLEENFADVDISADFRFGGLSEPTQPGTNNVGGFFLRKPSVHSNYTSTGEGQVEVTMYPGGGFLIRETHAGTLRELYADTPFAGGSANHLFSPAGSLPAALGGQPFDVDQNGVLEADEPFRLRAELAGDRLTVSVNGAQLLDLTVTRSAPPGTTSLVSLYKNRATGSGGLAPAHPTFDNLVVRGSTGGASPLEPFRPLSELIATNVESQLYGVNASTAVRIPFEVNDLTAQLSRLRMRFDDGFVASLNGVELSRDGAPPIVVWDSAATQSRNDAEVIAPVEFDLVAHTELLRLGSNVLAIQGLNTSALGNDFLILPELLGTVRSAPEDLQRTFVIPTPGRINAQAGPIGFAEPVSFSIGRGFYAAPLPGESPHVVGLSTSTPSATIVYTTDGSEPMVEDDGTTLVIANGTEYQQPITIASTSTLRATAFVPGFAPSRVGTETYLFLEDVLGQDGAGLPTTWGTFPNSSSIGGTPWVIGQDIPADWAVDPRIVDDPAYRDDFLSDLQAVPTVSLAVDPVEFFGDGVFPEGGIYVNSLQRGPDTERPVSVEYWDPATGGAFQTNAGVRIHGGASRRPDQTRKHSLRLEFRREYDGEPRLDFPLFAAAPFGETAATEFDSLILRASYSDGFSVGDLAWQAINLRDQWARDVQLALGQPAPHGQFVHLYINGFYWGLYNLTERIDGDFAASYFGGDADRYDVVTNNGVNEGDADAWNALLAMANPDLSDDEAYTAIQELLDVDNLIDYLIVQMFTGNWDWPGNNWIAVRERSPEGRFRFPVWDAEVGLGLDRNASGHNINIDQTIVSAANTPAQLYHRLRRNAEFRLRFADHLQQHLFDNGPLTPSGGGALFDTRVAEIRDPLVPETARWGDHNGNGGPTGNLPHTRDNHWQPEIDWIRQEWFPQRTEVVLDQFRRANLFPDLAAPQLSPAGGRFPAATLVTLTAAEGTIHYTLDGTDPRRPGGGVDPHARTLLSGNTLTIAADSTLRARTVLGDEWSPLQEARFQVTPLATADSLRISELHYHPAAPTVAEILAGHDDGDDFEFLELLNIATHPIDLAQTRLVSVGDEGLNFDLGAGAVTELQPGERLLVVEDRAAFQFRYGDGLPVAGQWQGGLSNNRELVTLVAGTQIVHQFAYDDDWYPPTDGRGPSLEVVALTQPISQYSVAAGWRPSRESGGTPGTVDAPRGDFDYSGRVDAADIDRLLAAVAQAVSSPTLDLTADGHVDDADVEELVRSILQTEFGDTNLDRIVDVATDARTVFGNLGVANPGGWSAGDFDGDGQVTASRDGALLLAALAGDRSGVGDRGTAAAFAEWGESVFDPEVHGTGTGTFFAKSTWN